MIPCPSCGGDRIMKNGRAHNGKQNHRCGTCGRQFVENPETGPIPQATKEVIGKLLLERLALAAIGRITGVSPAWLQRYVNDLYAAVPRAAAAPKKKRDR